MPVSLEEIKAVELNNTRVCHIDRLNSLGNTDLRNVLKIDQMLG